LTKEDAGFANQVNMEDPLEVEVGIWLRRRGFFLATAESCTGGLIGHLITNVPGSSDYYAGGIVAYANEAKMSLLDVPAGMLGMYGAVSREIALAMAQGVRQVLAAEIDPARLVGVSVTGVAGPGGGSVEKPVGLTWIGLSAADFHGTWRFVWEDDRVTNKHSSAHEALRLVVEYLRGSPRTGN
jgi:PncC family amidohydrolase